jgi:predicted DNA-binding transcriptional regulator AlpA
MPTTYLRFKDLKSRGIVSNWVTLHNRIKSSNFPSGRLIGPNARAWTEEEIDEWLASRPTGKAAPRRGARKVKESTEAA